MTKKKSGYRVTSCYSVFKYWQSKREKKPRKRLVLIIHSWTAKYISLNKKQKDRKGGVKFEINSLKKKRLTEKQTKVRLVFNQL